MVLLTENYRSHAKILELSNCFYGGQLIAKGDQYTHELVPVLSFYTAQGVDEQAERGLEYYNDAEVAEVVARVKDLINLIPSIGQRNVGVLTPYRDQVFPLVVQSKQSLLILIGFRFFQHFATKHGTLLC